MAGLTVPAYKVVMQGTLRTIQDWSVSVWLARTGGSVPTQAQATANAGSFGTQANTFWNAYRSQVSASDDWEALATYFYPAGATRAALVAYDTSHGSVHGTGSAAPLPTQLCQLISLRSATPGRSGRGRFYLPYTDGGSITNGMASNAQTDNALAAAVAYLQGLNGVTPAEGGSFQAIVASFTTGVAHPIVTAMCNNKLETQRRREDKISYTHAVEASI